MIETAGNNRTLEEKIESVEEYSTARKKRKSSKRKKKAHKTVEEMHRDEDYLLIYDDYEINGRKSLLESARRFHPDWTYAKLRKLVDEINESETVRKVAKNRINKRTSRSYMTVEQRKEYLTKVILGEVEDESKVEHRLKALQILNQMEGIGTPQNLIQQQNLQVNNITVGEKRELITQRLDELLGIPQITGEEEEGNTFIEGERENDGQEEL